MGVGATGPAASTAQYRGLGAFVTRPAHRRPPACPPPRTGDGTPVRAAQGPAFATGNCVAALWDGGGMGMDAGAIPAVNEALLAWFAIHRRPLPFRAGRTPYRVWVSEVMLQQTQAETAGARVAAFLGRFPDPDALAAADEQEVLAAWQGLGYYARARNLRRAAQVMVSRYGGQVPEDPAALRALPGVGAYIAAAVGTFAFGRDEAACDANVLRVLARLWNREGADRHLADTMVPPGRAPAWNDAMMDLGATVCLPRRPDCPRCPLALWCAGLAADRVGQLPARPTRPPKPAVAVCTVAARDAHGRWALVQRPERGLLAGMWECPSATGTADPLEVGHLHGLQLEGVRPLPPFRHVFTHRTWEVRPFCAGAQGDGVRWVAAPALWELPLAGPSFRLLRGLAGASGTSAN